ncbi:MAG: hypothetical protein J7L26_07535 [Candidatus Aminicenantes bacterium]|nr:hypothetical protein [Candidatus Aminicenantes bacterium]
MSWYNKSNMANQTFLKTTKLNNEILSLKEEVKILRSVIIGLLGKDKEGEYRPEFVEKVLKTSKEKSVGIFKDKKTFLKEIL